jgi:acid phosphatase
MRPSSIRTPRRRASVVRLGIALALLAVLLVLFGLRVSHPWFDRAYLIVLENNGTAQIVGNTAEAPYLNRLIAGYGLATDWQSPAHPSYPNYLALVAGTTFGITDDAPRDLDAPNLFGQLEAKGRTWHVYAQGYPGGCFLGEQADGGEDLGPAGTYVRRHVPPLSFTSITRDPARCANVTPMAGFDPAVADFVMVVPNDTNNMHDGSIRQGDDWLASFLPRILESPAFAHAALFITWDEGAETAGAGAGDSRVPMIVVRPGITPGFQSPRLHTHRAFLRTIEDAWGLGCLPAVCDSAPASEFFGG